MQNRLSLFLVLILGLYSSPSAWAEDNNASSSSSGSSASSSSSSSSAGSTTSFVQNFPQRLASFAVGTAVGTPIAVTRCTQRELIKQTKEAYKLGGVPKPFGWVTAAFFGLPSGVVCGIWYGVSDGVADSWVGSKKPFSKDAFSLDKLEW